MRRALFFRDAGAAGARRDEPRQDPDPRLRLAGHAADRAPRARSQRVLRDPPGGRQRRLRPRVQPEGRDPVGQPHVGLRGSDRQGAAGGVRSRRSGARHLLRHADDGAAARRPRRGRAHARVRLRRSAGARPHAAARRHRGRAQPRGLRAAEGLDEPRRQGGRDAARLQADGVDRELPGRRHGRRGPPVLRGAVPPGGDAHAAGPGDPQPLRAGDLRLQGRLGDGRLRRRGGREDPAAGRPRGSDPGPVGRGRFVGRGRADPSRDRQAAHLRVRRHRPAAARRGPAGDRHVRQAHGHEADRDRRDQALHGCARGRGRPGGEAQDHRPRIRARVPGGSGEAAEREVARAGDDLSRT